MVALDSTGVDLLIAQQIPHLFKTRLTMHRTDFNMIHSSAFIPLFDLTIGQALTPANHRQTAFTLSRVTPTQNCQQSRFIAGKGIREERRQGVLAKPFFSIVHQGQCGVVRVFTHHEGHHPLAIGCHRTMVPLITSFSQLELSTALLFFFTSPHGSSNSRAFGVRPCTC